MDNIVIKYGPEWYKYHIFKTFRHLFKFTVIVLTEKGTEFSQSLEWGGNTQQNFHTFASLSLRFFLSCVNTVFSRQVWVSSSLAGTLQASVLISLLELV